MDFTSLFGEYNQAVWTAILYAVWNASVQALPPPDLVSPNKFYVWFYGFAHGIAMNVGLVKKEADRRAIVHAKIQGTGDGTGTGTIKDRKEAVAEAKKEILKVAAVKLDAESSVPVSVAKE